MKMKSIFHTLIFLFIVHIAFSQSSNDSLKTLSYDSLKSLYIQHRFSNLENAKKIANAYYEKAIFEKNEKEISRGSFIYAVIYDALSQHDSAHYFIDMYISKSEKANDTEDYANGIFKKGVIFYHSRNFHNATTYYKKAYELVKNTSKKYKLAIISNSFGLLKNQFGQRDQAIEYFKESLAFYEKNNDTKNTYKTNYLNTLNNLSNTYTNLSEDYPKLKKAYLDSATIYNDIGLKESLKENDLEIYTSFLTTKGIISQKHKNLQEAFKHFFAAKKQVEQLSLNKQLRVLPSLQLHIGKNYFLNNEYDKAIEYLLKVDTLAEKEKITSPFFQETYILLAKCYEGKDDIKNALKYYKLSDKKDAENDQIIRKISEDLYKQYDIPSLKDKLNQLQNFSTKQTQLSKALIFIVLGLFTLLAFSYLLYRNRILKQKKRFYAIIEKLKKAENHASEASNTKSYNIKDENIVKILRGLEKFEKKKMFLQKNCTIKFVAKKINSNSTYLSRTLQTHKQKKFVQYITDLRIDYALTQLKDDPKFRMYDIKSIAAELGFNTSESFSKAFKKRTGIYPSFYIKNLDKISD